MKIEEIIEYYKTNIENTKEEAVTDLGVQVGTSLSNVVSEEKLRGVQINTLNACKDYLSKTFGPMGSNTKIVKGATQEQISTIYSKDGLKVLQHIICSGPIEASIVEELIELVRHVEKTVGDATTSSIILSALLFENLILLLKKYNIPPHKLIKRFNEVSDIIQKIIIGKAEDCNDDLIEQIAMVSTNSNEVVAKTISGIYAKYGLDVDITVGISNDEEDHIVVYDGLTITEGMSDPVFTNNKEKGTCDIGNAHVYHFSDPVDDMNMIGYFESILNHNIYDPMLNNEEIIPTVICCPRISRDMQDVLKQLTQTLYQYDGVNQATSKPPILIITNVVASDEVIMDDIANLCGCRSIHKYIDPKKFEADMESGVAPTFDNVWEWYGECQVVSAGAKKTKFINPKHMRAMNDGKEDPIYHQMIDFLESELKNSNSATDAASNGLLRKRLAALKANTVDYLVGGLTIADRDQKKDLIEDAIKNCRSAAIHGVGYAANFEALRALKSVLDRETTKADPLTKDIVTCLFMAYYEIARILYGTVTYDEDEITKMIKESLEEGYPFDVNDIENHWKGNRINCSIMVDVEVLNTLSKILTIMVTSNQCLVQAPNLNQY